MTRRSFFAKALGCLAACVLAPVRAVSVETDREMIVRLIGERRRKLWRDYLDSRPTLTVAEFEQHARAALAMMQWKPPIGSPLPSSPSGARVAG